MREFFLLLIRLYPCLPISSSLFRPFEKINRTNKKGGLWAKKEVLAGGAFIWLFEAKSV